MKNYFNFSKIDKIGVVTLSFLILILIVLLNVGGRSYIPDPFRSDQSDLIVTQFKKEKLAEVKEYKSQQFEKKDKESIRNFDPNSLDKEGWIKWGFSDKQANAILNYLSKAGPLEYKEQLKKIYVINEYQFNKMSPYILLPSQIDAESNLPIERIEINTATIEELKSIKGIGEYYASSIVEAREKHGGFTDFSMLKSFAKLPNDVDSLLNEQCIISPDLIQKQNINSIDKRTLRKIPFINWEITAMILEERSKNKIETLDFLTDSILSKQNKARLHHYFDF
ncbi:helix-hairpin-helix domain-containing protein [Crocinitomix catalasitica]|uniref:helix-hairpin-helix domain-containing protein n=1 Tax=Crocinitomix catalasitica TaxID=184607 RepID=UPI0005629013|nr:helix-hairpin-helix domain-containing protein [Crocinitomix catalasitica]